MTKTWVSELTPSILPDGICRAIAKEIGADNLLKLAGLVGGTTFYLPRKEGMLRQLRNRKIQEEYNGYNTAELAIKYGLSQRGVEGIVGRNTASSTSEQEKQEGSK